jgi:transposase-like protein
MGTARHRNPDEFKREALELLKSSGRPLSQIAGELAIPAARLPVFWWRMIPLKNMVHGLMRTCDW